MVTSADRTDPISLRRLRLPRLMLSRPVRFTNPFTYDARSLHRQASLVLINHRAIRVSRRAILRAVSGICGVRGTIARERNGELMMGDPMVPARRGGRHAVAQEWVQERAGIPAMPVISPSEQVLGGAYPLLDGLSPTIGWQFQSQAKGGPAFVILRRTGLGSLKVTEGFPLTDNGWARAWQSLVTQNPAAAPQVLARLKAREADAKRLRSPALDSGELLELDARSIASLRDLVYLGGYVPESPITAGERCDVRFGENRLLVFASHRADLLAEIPYSQIEDVEIGGPGMVKSGGGFTGGGFGLGGAIEGMAIAAVLNAMTTRTSITTIMRVQGIGFELFLLHSRLTPDRLRIEMSRTLGVIRTARAGEATARPSPETRPVSVSPVEELAKLADMLEKGLLTREEFDLMKARILGSPTI